MYFKLQKYEKRMTRTKVITRFYIVFIFIVTIWRKNLLFENKGESIEPPCVSIEPPCVGIEPPHVGNPYIPCCCADLWQDKKKTCPSST